MHELSSVSASQLRLHKWQCTEEVGVHASLRRPWLATRIGLSYDSDISQGRSKPRFHNYKKKTGALKLHKAMGLLVQTPRVLPQPLPTRPMTSLWLRTLYLQWPLQHL